ncbi:MAG: hypothetical protein V2I36_04565 [Desulfopila sp.]|nr:hypothetical protein [Desulfopila sp.]
MKIPPSKRLSSVLLILIFVFLSGVFATSVSGNDFHWPMFNAAISHPKLIGSGAITLRLKNNVIPHFDESASAQCELKSHTVLACGAATLRYDATEDNGQLKIRRNGSVNFMPVGTCTQTTCRVIHQATVQETMTHWVWTGVIWQQINQQSVTDTWDDILLFDLQQAVTSGSTVGTSTATGEAYWTLRLRAFK